MHTIRSATAMLVLLLGVPALALAQSSQMQPQRPGMGYYSVPAQPPGYDPGAGQGRSSDLPPPSRGIPGASQSTQTYTAPDLPQQWGHSPGWDRSGGRRPPAWTRPPGWYDPYSPPYYPYPTSRVVWVPEHWVWTGYAWAWQPGYWTRY